MNDGWLSITVNQINIFVEVVERKGFLAASRYLHMTQSAVSKSIARLENQLETVLFIRTTRNLQLTEEGEYLYEQWKEILIRMERACNQLELTKERQKNTLKIGLTSTTRPERYFDEIQKKCRERLPQLCLEVESEYMTELEEELYCGNYDAVFLPDFERFYVEEHQMRWKWAICRNAYVIMHSSHRLAQRESVRMADLLEEEFAILRHTMTPGYERDLRERFEKYHVIPKYTNIYHNANTLRHFFVPQREVLLVDDFYDYIEQPQVVRIKVEDEYNGIICAWNPNMKSSVIENFLEVF